MNTYHTPGPLKHENRHPQNCTAYVFIEAEPWHEIASLYASRTSPDHADGDGVWPADPERDANARLIAAAPELLASLAELLRHVPESWTLPGSGMFPIILTARSVLAKATA